MGSCRNILGAPHPPVHKPFPYPWKRTAAFRKLAALAEQTVPLSQEVLNVTQLLAIRPPLPPDWLPCALGGSMFACG